MLLIVVPGAEVYDEERDEFLYSEPTTLKLEHSLFSLKSWESKWKKPFLKSDEEKTVEQLKDYIKMMTLNENQVPDIVYDNLTVSNYEEIKTYLEDDHTATWFNEREKNIAAGGRGTVITAEIIYYWMIECNIPFECQYWNLNSLLTLIRVVSIKRKPSDKMSKAEAARRQHALNKKRRAKR